MEQFIMGTSETINEKIEEIQTQMSDLIVEVKSNVDLVEDKRRNNAKDTRQFIRVLCDDVRQFLVCMEDELSQVSLAMKERDLKCADDMKAIEGKLKR